MDVPDTAPGGPPACREGPVFAQVAHNEPSVSTGSRARRSPAAVQDCHPLIGEQPAGPPLTAEADSVGVAVVEPLGEEDGVAYSDGVCMVGAHKATAAVRRRCGGWQRHTLCIVTAMRRACPLPALGSTRTTVGDAVFVRDEVCSKRDGNDDAAVTPGSDRRFRGASVPRYNFGHPFLLPAHSRGRPLPSGTMTP
jgi:hypothetical protein